MNNQNNWQMGNQNNNNQNNVQMNNQNNYQMDYQNNNNNNFQQNNQNPSNCNEIITLKEGNLDNFLNQVKQICYNVIIGNPNIQELPNNIIAQLTQQLCKKEWFVYVDENRRFESSDFNFSEFGYETITVFRYNGIDLYICPLN